MQRGLSIESWLYTHLPVPARLCKTCFCTPQTPKSWPWKLAERADPHGMGAERLGHLPGGPALQSPPSAEPSVRLRRGSMPAALPMHGPWRGEGGSASRTLHRRKQCGRKPFKRRPPAPPPAKSISALGVGRLCKGRALHPSGRRCPGGTPRPQPARAHVAEVPCVAFSGTSTYLRIHFSVDAMGLRRGLLVSGVVRISVASAKRCQEADTPTSRCLVAMKSYPFLQAQVLPTQDSPAATIATNTVPLILAQIMIPVSTSIRSSQDASFLGDASNDTRNTESHLKMVTLLKLRVPILLCAHRSMARLPPFSSRSGAQGQQSQSHPTVTSLVALSLWLLRLLWL